MSFPRALTAALSLACALNAAAREATSRHYSNVSLGVGEAAGPAQVRAAAPVAAPAASAPAASAPALPRAAPRPVAPAARAVPPAPPPTPPPAPTFWPWLLLGAGAVFAGAALLRRGVRRRDAEAGETLALAAHELKSPLAAIESYLDLMAHEAPSDAGQARQWLEDVRRMKSTAAHLRRTIGDILDMTRIEDGRIKLAARPVALAPLLADVAGAYAARAAERSVRLETDAPGELAARADPDRLAQVLHNLIGNALKFTPEGKRVIVAARAARGRVVVEVRDEGVGVAPAARGRLFGKFQRLAPALDGTEGTGLGLYISRRLVEAQGGALEHAPRPGGGSVFRVELPPAGDA